MLEHSKISETQFRILVILYSIGDTILVVPGSMTADSKQMAWLPAILGVVIGVVLVWLYSAIGSLFPHKTLVELNEKILGKWLGKMISLLFVASTFLFCSQLLFYVGSFLTTQIMSDTPLLIIHIAFMIVVTIGIRLGLETLARCGEILFPWFMICFIILVFSISPQIKVESIQPLFGVGIKPILRSTLIFLSIAPLTFIVLLMIFPAHVTNGKKSRSAFFIGSAIGGLIMIIIILLSILVLGPVYAQITMYPSYELARRIRIGDFIQGIEVIIAIMWFLSLYFKLSIYYYATVSGLAQILELKQYRLLTLPLSIIIIVLSNIVYPSITYEKIWDTETWIPYSLIFGLFYPLLLLIIGTFRKKNQSVLQK
ncbi:GerAB/ArcD/ProY family transporter [Priestia megaterium]|nr:GerAB/ArcD/ProY family transporter [Priestia megaterium]